VIRVHPEGVTGNPDHLRAGEAGAIMRPVVGSESVLLLDGPPHLRQRKLLLPPFHGERMQRYGDVMREVTEREISTWPSGERSPSGRACKRSRSR